MRKYDFHKAINRYETASVKWELTKDVFGSSDVLPMWVADMDFEPPKEVQNAISKRASHEVFGYTFVPPSASEAVQLWQKSQSGWEIGRSWVLYSPGVVPSISIAIQAVTSPGDKIMLQSPVYTPFFEMIEKNGRMAVNSPLELVEQRYEIDFQRFEEELKKGIKLFLLCNPHNPGGRVWTKDELLKIGELCAKYGCLILSDEIHSDLVFSPHIHIPIASLSAEFRDISITCIAPSKTFNIAGLQSSAVIIPNEQLREKFKAVQAQQGFFTLNIFGITALEAAYRHGRDWLDQLISYLQENYEIARSFIERELPSVKVMDLEATYLMWLDCRNLSLPDKELNALLIEKGRIALEPGTKYGPGGEGFVRMNIACPRETLEEGLKRLKLAFS
ncbi:pyridoxal phosphate-dependent aminotransferase [Bacillus infantis]|uniref:MalY/PatB family protein n=1 Tax=Bacillus infantis TaxID=324767 RepID=UPI001CD1D188|nr:MalY/PatB family protein [Bacillus infantis]MCA1033959.1 pyridoxal phosphate-dependent aminotransferase [Bacillus infantis]